LEDKRREQLSKIVQSGEAVRRLTESSDWQEFLTPLLEQKLESLKQGAFNPLFVTDHILYVKHAAKYEAFQELVIMLNNAENAAKRAIKDLEDLDGSQS
jgi:hypothetical protein